MNNLENLSALKRLKPDYFGFIFYPKSPRNFDRFVIPNLENTKKVGVFVTEASSTKIKLLIRFQWHAVRLHSDEDQNYI
jgi:phosphoribosylanthranilate isomerase